VTFTSDLEREPWRFDFYAALRRVERSFKSRPRIGDSSSRRDEYLALGEDPYLEFPASTLSRADQDFRGRIRIFVKFLGLLGPQGALPLATTEEAYAWFLARDDAFPRFLDIFNHRFLQLFFRAWADARPVAQHDRPDADRFETYVGAMIGIGSAPYRGLDAVHDLNKLAFAGLLTPQAKSASRLESFLSGLFRADIEIDQFVGSRLVFEERERTLLGRRFCELGTDALVGGTVFSVQDKFRIRIHTKDLKQYRRFLPNGDWCEPLADAVFFYIGAQLDWEVELAIPARAVEPLRLGRFGELGWTSWMAPGFDPDDATSRRDARFHPAERVERRRRAGGATTGGVDNGRH
jgi:type VI secretion system protein ImpH